MKTRMRQVLPCMTVILAVTASGVKPALADEGAKPCVVANYKNAADACPPNVKPVKTNRNLKLSFNLSKLADLPKAVFGKKEEPKPAPVEDAIAVASLEPSIREAELPVASIPSAK